MRGAEGGGTRAMMRKRMRRDRNEVKVRVTEGDHCKVGDLSVSVCECVCLCDSVCWGRGC